MYQISTRVSKVSLWKPITIEVEGVTTEKWTCASSPMRAVMFRPVWSRHAEERRTASRITHAHTQINDSADLDIMTHNAGKDVTEVNARKLDGKSTKTTHCVCQIVFKYGIFSDCIVAREGKKE